jgi:hypothetical protein
LQLRQALLHSGGSPLFATVYVRAAALVSKSDQPADALKRKKFAQLIADLADAKCNLIMCVCIPLYPRQAHRCSAGWNH